jgi:hypothetical protein
MKNQSWLWLLSIASVALFFPLPARAQIKQSHHALPDSFDEEQAKGLMAERLKELQEMHQLQDQMRDLLKDPNFLNNVKNNFSEEQLRQLREKILKGKGLSGDGDWQKLLDQTGTLGKFNDKQKDLLRRWAERQDVGSSLDGFDPSKLLPDNGSSPPMPSGPERESFPTNPSSPSTPSAQTSLWDQLQQKSSTWFENNMDGFAGDLVRSLEELGVNDEGGPLADFLRSIKRRDLVNPGISLDNPNQYSRFLPHLAEMMHNQRGAWDDVRSIFREAQIPSMPSFTSGSSLPSLPAPSSPSGDDWGGGTLALVALGLILIVLWKTGGLARLTARRAEVEAWRLGPWPVRPSAVSTRQDLIRAFEHLALLCLGISASTCHHRELADRLAVKGDDPPRRRQAADLLAWLYEQCRYAPAEEPLTQDELIEARHALAYLSGVTAA